MAAAARSGMELRNISHQMLNDWTDKVRRLRRRTGCCSDAGAMFSADALLAWAPRAADLPREELRFVLNWWQELAPRSADLPSADIKLDPLTLRPVLGYLLTLDVVAGGDFRFRLYGSKIAQRAGFDMTGKLVSEIPSPPDTVAFFLATYRAAQIERAPLYTEHTPWSGISTTRWHRLILPFADASGAVARFVVANLPGSNRIATGGVAA
ncbi:MAG: PAS domain-containing protein [Rhodospirillaceae bacterium]|nr:PAS domain-containing protein [Rhodospirillaceae bacterium]